MPDLDGLDHVEKPASSGLQGANVGEACWTSRGTGKRTGGRDVLTRTPLSNRQNGNSLQCEKAGDSEDIVAGQRCSWEHKLEDGGIDECANAQT